jgi:CBS domain-containing protein
MGEVRATQIAASIGQLLAIVAGIAALLSGQILLMLIAFFVYIGAGQEVQATVGFSLITGRRVGDATQTRFRTIDSGASLDRAASMLLEGSQQDFPVMAGDEVIGVLTRTDITRGLASEGPTGYVAGHMRREVRRISADQPLERAMELLSEENVPLLVYDGAELIGMLTADNLSEFMMLQHARQQSHPQARP